MSRESEKDHLDVVHSVTMVLVLTGKSEIGAHVWNDLVYLINLRRFL